MKAKRTKTSTTFHYTGDLAKEVRKCENEIRRKRKQQELEEPLFERLRKERNARLARIDDLESFVKLAKKEMKANENKK